MNETLIYKEHNVVMLATSNEPIKGQLLQRHLWKGDKNECNSLWQFDEVINYGGVKQYTTLGGSFRDWYKSFVPQHLYALSDEKPKENDWVIFDNKEEGTKYPLRYSHKIGMPSFRFKKIIATTNPELKIESELNAYYRNGVGGALSLPRFSNDFIKAYIKAYNSGAPITKIMVGYENSMRQLVGNKIGSSFGNFTLTEENKYKLKAAPDNTITVKPVEDEIENLLRALGKDLMQRYQRGNGVFQHDIDNWIKENYNPPTRK